MEDAAYYWNMFLETGSPAAYLLYKEQSNVSNHDGDRPTAN